MSLTLLLNELLLQKMRTTGGLNKIIEKKKKKDSRGSPRSKSYSWFSLLNQTTEIIYELVCIHFQLVYFVCFVSMYVSLLLPVRKTVTGSQ